MSATGPARTGKPWIWMASMPLANFLRWPMDAHRHQWSRTTCFADPA